MPGTTEANCPNCGSALKLPVDADQVVCSSCQAAYQIVVHDEQTDLILLEPGGGESASWLPNSAAEETLLRVKRELAEAIDATFDARNRMLIAILMMVFGVCMLIYGISQTDARVYICGGVGVVLAIMGVVLLMHERNMFLEGKKRNDELIAERKKYEKILNQRS